MRSGKLTVCLFTLLFAAVALVLWAVEPRPEIVPMALSLSSGEHNETITCWKNAAGEYYLFLPGYGEWESAEFQLRTGDVRIDGKPVEDGMSCAGFSLDTPYAFSFASREGEVHTSLTFTRSSGLPTLHLDTNSGNMEHIHSKKGNAETGRMRLYLPNGSLAYTGDLDGINGRGNDWLIPKKSYSLKLAAAADLLDMGQAEKWILQANSFDASHLRNKLVYDFSAELGLAYSPESQWVDLYLNGEYAGLYLLCERNEIHEQRVRLEGNENYLVSMDLGWRLEENKKPFLMTHSGHAFRIHSSQIRESSLQQLLQSVENAIYAEDGTDPVTGKHWSELIDLDSWAKKYLIEEIFGNGDAGAISQYFYGSSQTTRMFAGPVWDFDVSMGNAQAWRVTNPCSVFAGRSRTRANIGQSWFYGLYQQEAFYDRLVSLYQENCLPLLDTVLYPQLEASVSRVAQSAAMNQIRWENIGAYQNSASAEAENIRSYMVERIAFLNQLWLEQKPYYYVLIDANDGNGTACFAVRPGEHIPFLPEYEQSSEILDWYAVGSEEPFDISQPIWEDMEIVLIRTE